MKLKKIASLAMAGVLAVSMLAGCATKTPAAPTTDEEVTVDTSAVSAMNEEVDSDLLKYEYSTDLQKNLELAVRVNGDTAEEANVTSVLVNILDVTNTKISGFNTTPSKGTRTAVHVKKIDTNMSDAQVMKTMANFLKGSIDDLKDEVESGSIKYTFTYTGDVAMVKVEQNDSYVTYIATVTECVTDGTVVEL